MLHGNVVHATHGETRHEVLGGGSTAGRTAVPPPPATVDLGPRGHRLGDRGHTGGPRRRRRLARGPQPGRARSGHSWLPYPTGRRGRHLGGLRKRRPRRAAADRQDNVRATYRNGIGKPGNVAARQISLLATRPLGVKDVVNPLRASGGADQEAATRPAERAAGRAARWTGLVSTQDYADFARTFAGVGKAAAARLTDGRRQLVHVTIAGVDDIPIDPSSDLFRNLTPALHRFGDPHLPIRSRCASGWRWSSAPSQDAARPPLGPRRAEDPGRAARRLRLRPRRELGEDVLLSEAIPAMQAVPGVVYVDVDVFDSRLRGGRRPAAFVPVAGSRRLGRDRSPLAPRSAPAHRVGPASPVVVTAAPGRGRRDRAAQLAYLQPSVPDTLILQELDR